MEELLMGMAFLIIGIILFQLVRQRQVYKLCLYRGLYSSYLEWFLRLYFKKDLSKSQPLLAQSDYAKILFHSSTDPNKKRRTDFVIILVPQGVYLFVVLNHITAISGRIKDDKWLVKTSSAQGKVDNFYRIGLEHKRYLESKLKDKKDIKLAFLVNDTCDFTRLESGLTVIKASQLLDKVTENSLSFSDGELMDIAIQLEKENRNG